jgi:hypothetical protein
VIWRAVIPGYNAAMRFRLRTLLIVMAIAGLACARVGHLKRMAADHRHAVAHLIPAIARAERDSKRGVESAVRHLATNSVLKTIVSDLPLGTVIILENGAGNGVVIQNNSALSNWRNAVHHSVLAAQYERAVYRPWMLVSETAEQ